MNPLQRIVRMSGAFDRRHPDDSKNYGIHGMEIRFVLKGDLGAVQFVVYTPLHLPHVTKELWDNNRHRDWNPFKPMGADIGYHSPTPRYDGQHSMDCDLMPSGKCYYDGSGLQAEEFLPTFLAGGDEAVWPMLEERYRELFDPSSSAVSERPR
jgi:hypothetical protein